MKKLFSFILSVFFMCSLSMAVPFSSADSSASNIFEIEREACVRRISFEKTRITNDYQNADSRLFNLIDSLVNYVVHLDVTAEKRNLYLKRLEVYVTNMNRYYTDAYLKNGTYLAVLSYYPSIIQWHRGDVLLQSLKRYSSFSIKAIRLVPSDAVAEEFLTDYMNQYPDETFRYTEEFDDRPFATSLLEKALKFAPESARRYLSNLNPVNALLSRSKDPYVTTSYAIVKNFGLKSRAFLLLDPIVKGEMGLAEADSLGSSPDQLFATLVSNSAQYEANVTYSIYRYLDIYSIDEMRNINGWSLDVNYQFNEFRRLTLDQMFVLMAYGYQETTTKTFQKLLAITKQKLASASVRGGLIGAMDKNKLKGLIIYCDKNNFLSDMLSVVDESKRDYLLALSDIEERQGLFPPFKSFSPGTPVSGSETADLSLNEIIKAKAPIKPQPDDFVEPSPDRPELNSTASQSALADAVPAPMPEPEPVFEPIHISLDDRTKAVMSLKKNIIQSIQRIQEFIHKPYAEEVLLYAAEREPDELFKKAEFFKSKAYARKVLEVCSRNAPISLKRYLYSPNHPVTIILGYSNDPVVKRIIAIQNELGYRSKPLLLIEDLVKGKFSVQEAITIAENPARLFSALVEVVSRPGYIGKYSIDHEMRDYSLRFVREINDKIASGSSQPFYSVEGFNSKELYYLMLYGRDEVFSSTFNGLFNRFLLKLPSSDGDAFLQSVNHNRFRDFLSLCGTYGLLEQFLLKFEKEKKQELVLKYVSRLENERDDLSSVVLIAEGLSNISDPQLLAAMEKNIKKEFERVRADSNIIGITVYGVLCSIVSDKAKTESKWFKMVAKQFEVTPAGSLTSATLFANGAICVEQMYFYNDDDGRSSYINFLNTYKNQSNWTIEDNSSFVRIFSITGKRVEIFANKPDFEENGNNAIREHFTTHNLVPTVVIHRGHSFHTEATLERVPGTAKLVFVGSCGGFYKLSIAIENAPDAHFIATRQIGTKTVNDAMIFTLNEVVREGRDINWNDFWQKMDTKLSGNQYFSDYIPPNKNLESIFIKAYFKVLGV